MVGVNCIFVLFKNVMKGSTYRLGQSSKKAKSNAGSRFKRNQNSKKSSNSKVIRPWLNNLKSTIISYSSGTVSNNGNGFNNAYGNLHPNYALNNGTTVSSLGRTQISGSNSSTVGFNVKFVVMQATLEITILNKEAFAQVISAFGVNSNMGSVFTARPQTDQSIHSIISRIVLEAKGVLGANKKFVLKFNVAKLEGISPTVMRSLAGYHCTTAAAGSIIPYFYIQVNAIPLTLQTAAGFDYDMKGTFEVIGVFQNLALEV